jgi:hypothetical protein
MEVSVGDAFAAFTYTNEIKGSHSVEVIYFATFTTPISEITINPEDHSEFVWVGADEVDTICTENKRGDDPEIMVIRRGFELLAGGGVRG